MNGYGGPSSGSGSSANGGTIADKLGLGPSIRELKFGPGFGGGSSSAGVKGNNSFHTIRYDFKPASVDASQPSSVDIGPNKQITISIPHSDGAGSNVFKGPIKPYAKECVLIIDHETGEVTLEKLTHNIQVKKTRQERPEGASRSTNPTKVPPAPAPTPPVPPPPPEKKKAPPPPPPPPSNKSEKDSKKSASSSKSSKHSNSSLLGNNRPTNNRPNSPKVNSIARHSPGLSPREQSPLPESKPQQPNLPSLSSIEDLILGDPPPAPTPPPPPAAPLPKPRAIIASKNGEIAKQKKTDSSAESSSSGTEESSSSSSSESESESSDDEEMIDVDDIPIAPMKHLPMMPMLPSHKPKLPPAPAAAPSMPSFMNHSPEPSSRKQNSSLGTNSSKSMPTHLLSQDLNLSDTSDSDSD